MCKIGCNWSKALQELILNKQVDFDYIKAAGVYDEFERNYPIMHSFKPILLHGLGCWDHSGMKSLDIVDFQRANRIITECGSPHYGLHLAIEFTDMSEEDIFLHMSKQIQIFKKNLCVPLLLENLPDCPRDRTVFNHYPYVEPRQINRILSENDVDLLLDLTHAKITALFRGWSIYDYLRELPLHRIKEIHVNGSGYDEQDFPADTHQSMTDEDYKLLEWVLKYSNPDIVTLEYIGIATESHEVISLNLYNQLKELNFICR